LVFVVMLFNFQGPCVPVFLGQLDYYNSAFSICQAFFSLFFKIFLLSFFTRFLPLYILYIMYIIAVFALFLHSFSFSLVFLI